MPPLVPAAPKAKKEPTKRLTVDMSLTEHTRLMRLALDNNTKVNPMLRKLLAGMSDEEISKRISD